MEEQQSQPTKQERRELRRQEKIEGKEKIKQKRLYKRVAIWLIVLFGIGGGVFGIANLAQSPVDSGAVISVSAVTDNDWVKGDRESSVILIKYSDFQCSACASYDSLTRQLADEFGNDIAFVYRHFPLGIFPHSRIAAQAAEAAGKQGKFWEMHDMIFDNQRTWSTQRKAKGIFETYAEQLGLNMEEFQTDIDSKDARNKINNDHKSGLRERVNSTPTFFLNGEKIQNPRGYEEFRALIQGKVDAVQEVQNSN